MAFMVNTDGTILADTAADAVALSELLRGRTAPPPREAPVDDPIPFKVTAKPRALKLAPPKVTAKGTPRKRRPRGTGSIFSPDGGDATWSWKVVADGSRTVKHGFPTREAAEAALDAHLAGAVQMVQTAQGVGVSPAGAGPFAHLPKFVGEWAGDGNGLQKHVPCNGSGKVDDPDKARGKTRCNGCKGEGFRRVV